MPLTRENIRIFCKLFISSYEESSHEELKFPLFPTYARVTLIMSKLQIHPVNPTDPHILKFIAKFL